MAIMRSCVLFFVDSDGIMRSVNMAFSRSFVDSACYFRRMYLIIHGIIS